MRHPILDQDPTSVTLAYAHHADSAKVTVYHHGTLALKGQTLESLALAIIEVARETWQELACVPIITRPQEGELHIAVYGLADTEQQEFETWLWRLNAAQVLTSLGLECPPNTLDVVQ
jgi:hypothetical protein